MTRTSPVVPGPVATAKSGVPVPVEVRGRRPAPARALILEGVESYRCSRPDTGHEVAARRPRRLRSGASDGGRTSRIAQQARELGAGSASLKVSAFKTYSSTVRRDREVSGSVRPTLNMSTAPPTPNDGSGDPLARFAAALQKIGRRSSRSPSPPCLPGTRDHRPPCTSKLWSGEPSEFQRRHARLRRTSSGPAEQEPSVGLDRRPENEHLALRC